MPATYRRNTGWFVVLLVVFLVSGYAVLTYAVAGSDSACNGGGGRVQWQWNPVPKFTCTTGPRFGVGS